MDEKTIDRIFAGSLEQLPAVSSKIVRIFTSSTFTGMLMIYTFCFCSVFHCFLYFIDTTMERNTLMAQCYPKLKDYCREKHGLEFQVSIFVLLTKFLLNRNRPTIKHQNDYFRNQK